MTVDGVSTKNQNTAYVSIEQFDNSTLTYLIWATGSTSDATFNMRGNCSSATLSAIIPVHDTWSGNNFNVSVNLNWTATSPAYLGTYHTTSHTEGMMEIYNSVGKYRYGTASGTVSDGSTNFILGLSGENITIGQSSTSSVSIQANH